MIAILDYEAGNIQSVSNALDRLGASFVLTDEPEVIDTCERLIIPGVGEAGRAMASLRNKQLDSYIKQYTRPVLGICLGMQILCNYSEESDTECLGIFECNVRKFIIDDKIPHMGWNNVHWIKNDLWDASWGVQDFYFVHSFYADLCSHTAAVSNYGHEFSSVLELDNFYGVQFHPEKSAKAGNNLLMKFLSL